MAVFLRLLMLFCLVGLGVSRWPPHDVTAKIAAILERLEAEGLAKREHSPLINMTTPELIEYFGYPVEIHQFPTSDGYVMELHRIPYGISGPTGEGRPVAFLVHGLLCTSSAFIMNEPGRALAYMLADAGYDVWLSNLRGNTYSHSHETLDPEKVGFWQFSWGEMAAYDVPESIDYVLGVTGATGVYYSGWSMGTTVFWAMLSEKPEYNDKIKAMAAMAPVAYLNHIKGILAALVPICDELDTIMTIAGKGELFPSSQVVNNLVETFCDVEAATAEICYDFLYLLCGPDPDELNKEHLPVIMALTLGGTSDHTVNHYAQVALSGLFQKYDYGRLGNLNHYGQDTPPLYNLSNVLAPVGLFWGNTDWLATPEDVAALASELPNVALNYNIDKTEFNHVDFGWAIHGDELVYRHVVDFFALY